MSSTSCCNSCTFNSTAIFAVRSLNKTSSMTLVDAHLLLKHCCHRVHFQFGSNWLENGLYFISVIFVLWNCNLGLVQITFLQLNTFATMVTSSVLPHQAYSIRAYFGLAYVTNIKNTKVIYPWMTRNCNVVTMPNTRATWNFLVRVEIEFESPCYKRPLELKENLLYFSLE